MPARDVLGRSVFVDMKIDGFWFPIMCAKVNQFDLEQDEIETTHVNSGPNREYVPGMANATVGVTGITRVNNGDGKVNIIYLLQQSVRRQIHTMRMRLEDQVTPTSNVSVISFNAFVRSTNITSDRTLLSNASVTFRVTGGLTFDTIVPAPAEPICEVQSPLYIDAVAGESSVSDSLLEVAGVSILEVQRTGVGHKPTSGTPGNLEYKFTGGTGNGTVDFDPNNTFLSGEVIYVLYKIPV